MEFKYVQKILSQLRGMEKTPCLFKWMAILALTAVTKRVQQVCL